MMTEHILGVRFTGRLADRNRMDASDNHHADEGAKQLLAALAYAYCYGSVPSHKHTNTDLFYIQVEGDGRGSFLLSVIGGIIGSAIYDVARYSFIEFAVPALRAWAQGGQPIEPLGVRLQEHLVRSDFGNAPIFDQEAHCAEFWASLNSSFDSGAARITRTLGRYADRAEIALDGTLVRTFDRRFYPAGELENAIEAAVTNIRMQRDRIRYS